MPVPNTMADLAQLAGSNSPAGTEPIGNSLDNYIRAVSAILRSTNALSSSSIGAAPTVDVSTSDGESVLINGSSTITSLGTGFNGCRREVRFNAACTIVHSGNLQLPNGTNIATASGDVMSFRCVGSGQWLMTAVNRAQLALAYTPVNKAGDTMTGNLMVTGSGAPSLTTTSAGGVITAYASSDAFSRGFMGTTSAHGVGIFTSNVMRIDVAASGTVGIGKTAGPNILELQSGVNTTLLCKTTGGIDGILASVDGLGGMYLGTGTNHGIGIYTNNVKRIDITNSGAVSIGGGFGVTKVTVSSSAPGALAQGEIYYQTT